MRSLLCSAHNSLTRHARVEFASGGDSVSVATATKANGMRSAAGYPAGRRIVVASDVPHTWLDHSLIRSRSRR
jgi:hypothetical protein